MHFPATRTHFSSHAAVLTGAVRFMLASFGTEVLRGPPSMTHFLDDASLVDTIASWLPKARWFSAKGQSIEKVTLIDWVALESATSGRSDRLFLAIVNVGMSKSHCSPLPFVVPIAAATNGSLTLYDAAFSPDFTCWLLRLGLTGQQLATRIGYLRGHCLASGTQSLPESVPEVTILGGDASNSSALVRAGGQAWMIKLLRHCRAGIQPEVEIGTFFVEQASWSGTPRLLGWIESVDDQSPPLSRAIATIHAFVPGCTSAWDRLGSLLAAGGLASGSGESIFRLVAMLGNITAEMHTKLGSRNDILAFSPQPLSRSDRQAVATAMVDHARQVLAQLSGPSSQFSPAIRKRLQSVVAASTFLIARLDSLVEIDSGSVSIRVHGDYHLGQILIGPNDTALWVIDFEGEPSRSLNERRMTSSVLKDVAGMCRSFDYLLRHAATGMSGPALSQAVSEFEACFLKSYTRAASGQMWWPKDPRHAAQLFEIYKLDKAIYELAYESNNRPDWIEVPLAAIEECLALAR